MCILEESEDGKYEVLFGDDIIGRKPVTQYSHLNPRRPDQRMVIILHQLESVDQT